MAAAGKKRLVLAWELGEGMGHVVPYLPLATSLQSMGCEVVLAVRDPGRVRGLTERAGIRCVQAPAGARMNTRAIRVPSTYTHILHNNGFSDLRLLAGMVGKWRELFDTLSPSLVIFEHSPTAVLASRGCGFLKIHMGTGFTIPPDLHPLPNLRTWLTFKPGRLEREEELVLGVMNRVLARCKAPPLRRIGELFSQDLRVLMTYKELDPYGERPGQAYWGTWMTGMGRDPVWPDRPGKRIFAYLKPFPGLTALLTFLDRAGTPTLAYIPGLDAMEKEKLGSPALTLVDEPVNMEKTGAQCDVAVLNGTHHTTAQLLLSGKPTLHFPLYLEQHLTARKIEELGVGLCVADPKDMEKKASLMLNSGVHARAAADFAVRYKAKKPGRLRENLVSFIAGLLE